MVSMLLSSAVDRGFETWLGKTQDSFQWANNIKIQLSVLV
jgi:hypothetical protein